MSEKLLASFFTHSKNLYGTCPHCGELFSASEVEWRYGKKAIPSIRDSLEEKYQVSFDDKMDRQKDSLRGFAVDTLAPYCPEFCNKYNPKDARHLGNPIDFVVFNNMFKKDNINGITFVEIKSWASTPRLNEHESQIRDVVEEGKVYFDLINIKPKQRKTIK